VCISIQNNLCIDSIQKIHLYNTRKWETGGREGGKGIRDGKVEGREKGFKDNNIRAKNKQLYKSSTNAKRFSFVR